MVLNNLKNHAFIGCTDVGGLHFWCSWNDGSRKIIPIDLTEPFQYLVLNYLENHLVASTHMRIDHIKGYICKYRKLEKQIVLIVNRSV